MLSWFLTTSGSAHTVEHPPSISVYPMFLLTKFAQLADTLQVLDGFDLSQDKDKNLLEKADFDVAKKALLVMKNVKQILDSLCADVTAEVAALTARIMPASLHHGLESIPDEVLSCILVLDTYASNYMYMYGTRPKVLRRVNRRFRNVVSSTPECWSRITPETPRRNIFLDHPVDLEDIRWETKESMSYYQGRIRHLELNTGTTSNTCIEDKDLENLDLSSVKSLVVRGEGVLSTTHFPQLTSLSCPYIPLPSGLQLTHCKLDIPIRYVAEFKFDPYEGYLDVYNLECGPDYDELLRFLTSMPSLQSLSLPVDTQSYLVSSDSETITLPNLKYLHIRTNCLSDTFLKVLECPVLEVMDVLLDKFHNAQGNDGTKYLSKNFPSMTCLKIRGDKNRRIDYYGNLRVSLSDVHRTFPSLRSLIIDGEFMVNHRELREQNGDIFFDSLKSISFCIPLQLIECYGNDDDTGLLYNRPQGMCYDNWANLSTIFRWYKENGAQLKYLGVKGRPREERKSQPSAKDLSVLFPEARIHV